MEPQEGISMTKNPFPVIPKRLHAHLSAYHVSSDTSRLLFSLEDILLRTLVTHNYYFLACKVTLSFMDTLITLTYLLTYLLTFM